MLSFYVDPLSYEASSRIVIVEHKPNGAALNRGRVALRTEVTDILEVGGTYADIGVQDLAQEGSESSSVMCNVDFLCEDIVYDCTVPRGVQ